MDYTSGIMPFGLCNAPATFQRFMNFILGKYSLEFCLVYLDDIIIFSRNFKNHLKNVTQVLEELYRAGLKLNYEKSIFLVVESNT